MILKIKEVFISLKRQMGLTEDIIELLRITAKRVCCNNCGKMCLIKTTLYSLKNVNQINEKYYPCLLNSYPGPLNCLNFAILG